MTRSIALLLSCLAIGGAAVAAELESASIRIGGDVHITEAVDGPLHAVGGTVTLDAPVKGKVLMAGGSVRLGASSAVDGDVSVAGGSVDVDGPIQGKLRAAGGNVRIDGPVAGDASIAAGTLELGPNARIDGKLTFHGEDLRRDPAAQVVGGVQRTQGRSHTHEPHTMAWRFAHGWLWSVGLMVLAALIAGALPGASDRMARELRERPWLTPLLGLVALTSIPIAAVLMMITIIGIPIGLLALIGYVALLFVGYVWLAVVVGAMLLDRMKPEIAARTAWRVGAAVLTMLVLALLVRVPFLGGMVKVAVLVVGVGMIVAAIMRRARPGDTVAA